MVKGAIYDAVKTEAMRRGQSEAEAEALADDAQSYTGQNWYNILIGGALGGIGGRLGVERSIAKIAVDRALGRITAEQAEAIAARLAASRAVGETTASVTRRSVLGGAARGAGAEAVPEMAQAGQEQFATNVALSNAGFETDPLRGVTRNAVVEGLVGGILGGAAGGVEARSRNKNVDQLERELAVLSSIEPDIEANIVAAADGNKEAADRLRQGLIEFGLDDDMAENRANSYVAMEVERRKSLAESAAPQTAPVDEGIDLGGMPPPAPAAPTPAAPTPAAPALDEELPQRERSGIESQIARLTALRDDDRYIARQSFATGESDTDIIAELDEQIAELAARLPSITSTYTPRTLQERGAALAAQTMSGTISGVDVDALSPEEKLGYNNALMEAEFSEDTDTGITEPASEAATSDTFGFEGMSTGMSSAIGQNLRSMLLAKVEAGDVTENGQPTAILQVAKLIKDSGVPVDVEMLDRISMAVDTARQSDNFNESLRAFVRDATSAPEPAASTEEFLPGELFADESVETAPAAESVDEAAVIDELIADQQALFDAEPVKSTPRAQRAKKAIQDLQDAKEGLALELPFETGVEATQEQVEAAQASLAEQAATSKAKQARDEEQIVAETQAMVNGLGSNYEMYKFQYLPNATTGHKFKIYAKLPGGVVQRSGHKTLKSFLGAVDNLKGITKEAEDARSAIKSGAGLKDEGYKSSRTAGHKAIQELTAEIDLNSATGRKKLSNLQRTELLRMLENPVKRYEVGENKGAVRSLLDEAGNPIPYTLAERRMDALFREVEKRTKAVRDTQAKIDASGEKKKDDASLAELRKTLKTRNEKLLEAVRNITEPVRARMQDMIESRENELFGAKHTAEQLAVEEKLGFADLADMREIVETLRPRHDAYLATEAAIKFITKRAETEGKTPLEIVAATEKLQKKLKRLKPKYDEYLEARKFLDEQMAALAEVRADRRIAQQDFEEARVYSAIIGPRLEQMPMESTAVPVDYEVAFGPKEIDALLAKAVEDGVLTKEGAEFTRWFISKNPAIAATLDLKLSNKLTEQTAASYDVIEQAVTLIPDALSKRPSIGVHEVLHHTERMLPAKLRKGIRQLWKRDFDAFRNMAQDSERAYMDALAAMHAATDPETFAKAKDEARDMLSSGAVSLSLYRYINPSEYWAEMGSEILTQRFGAKNSTMAKIKQWYRELLEKLKDIFGKDSAAPVIRALDNILNGDGSFAANSMLFSRRSETSFEAPKIPPKMVKKFRKSGEDISEGMQTAQLTQETQEIANASFGTIKHHLSSGDVIGYLNTVWKSTDSRTLAPMLKLMPASGIVGWKEKELPGLQTIIDLVDKMVAMKYNLTAASEDIAQQLNEFIQKHGDELLGKTMITARINRVSLGQFATVEEALQKDPALVNIRQQMAQSTADTQKMARLKKDEKKRTVEVRDSYTLWGQLAKQPGGQQLYLKMRNYHKMAYIAMRAAQDKLISGFADKEQRENLLVQVRRAEEEAAVRDPEEGYTDLPPDVFPRDYFPFQRFGKYYLKVAAYKGQKKEFYTYDTPGERNAALRAISARMGIDVDSDVGKRIFDIGDDISVLQEEFHTDDEMMRKVFEELQKVEDRGGAVGPTEIKQMKQAIYQVYLLSAPERSLRRSFLKAENVTGMSTDVLRGFSSRAASVSSQIARAEYGNDVRLAIEAAYNNIDPEKTRDIDERNRLRTIVTEIANRAKTELDPKEPGFGDTAANFINRAAFVYFLTAPATAAVQFTSIPIRVVPHLGARYGYVETNKIWIKYMKVWETVGSGDGKGIADVLSSKVVKSNPVLTKALKAGIRRGVLDTLGQTLVNNEVATGRSSRGKTAQYAIKLHNVMTYMFNSSENITKQAAYLMAFELEHNKLLAKEKPKTEQEEKDVFERAVSSALKTVNDTIGNYSSIERPSALNNPLGRFLFLFKAYVMNFTKWFVGSMRRAVGSTRLGVGFGNFTSEERAIARKDLLGVFLMGTIFAGVPGFPLYSLVVPILKALEDDEEERENRMRNPYTANDPDLWFRYEYLPSKFGEAEIFGRPISAIMANGLISEFTGVNVASRTGMDLRQMWFRDSPDGDTMLGSLGYALLANIAPGGMLSNFDKANTQLQDGNWSRALEFIAPGFFRNWLTVPRLASEGIKTNTGKTVMSPEEFSAANLVAQFVGFQPLEASKVQQMRVKVESLDASIQKERTDLMGAYANALREGADAETIRSAAENIVEFNELYPLPELMISMEDLERSIRTREQQIDVRGVTVTKKEQATKERAFEQIR
jgi:hypothetical protein